MRSTNETSVRDGDRLVREATLAIGLAAFVIGVSFGGLAAAKGLSIGTAVAMSAGIFAGGSQFLVLGVIGAGGSALAAVLGGLLLNARHLPFGLALAPRLWPSRTRRAAAAYVLVDESAALALAQPTDRLARRALVLSGVAVFVAWNVGTVTGAVVGRALGDPDALGLDAAFPAAILFLVASRLRSPRGRAAILGGAVVAVGTTPLLPAGGPILAAAAAGLLALAFRDAP